MATRCTQRPGSVAGVRFFDVATINIHRTMDTAQIGMNCIFARKEGFYLKSSHFEIRIENIDILHNILISVIILIFIHKNPKRSYNIKITLRMKVVVCQGVEQCAMLCQGTMVWEIVMVCDGMPRCHGTVCHGVLAV